MDRGSTHWVENWCGLAADYLLADWSADPWRRSGALWGAGIGMGGKGKFLTPSGTTVGGAGCSGETGGSAGTGMLAGAGDGADGSDVGQKSTATRAAPSTMTMMLIATKTQRR